MIFQWISAVWERHIHPATSRQSQTGIICTPLGPINSTISQKSDRLILWVVVQDMDVDNDLGDVAESEEADSPKRSAKKIPLVV